MNDYPEYDDGAAHQLLLEQEKREHREDCTCANCIKERYDNRGKDEH